MTTSPTAMQIGRPTVEVDAATAAGVAQLESQVRLGCGGVAAICRSSRLSTAWPP
jgi:hypothetical protein